MGLVAAALSVVTYKFIIQRQGTVTSYLVGYGFLVPLWLLVPYYQVELFDCRNTFMRFCFAVIVPIINVFHITEGAYNAMLAFVFFLHDLLLIAPTIHYLLTAIVS